MTAFSSVVTVALAAGLLGATAAYGADTYTYTVHHPTYGDIGTYTDRIERDGETMRIETTVNIVVRVLGIVMHREQADRTELWRDDRLTAFHGVTRINGEPVEVRGEARPDGFALSTPTGDTLAPRDLVPSEPWQLGRVAGVISGPFHGTIFSTRSGRMAPFELTGGEMAEVSLNGRAIPVRHYVVTDYHRQEVWIDAHGVPIVFRTVENGTPIDMRLSRESRGSLAAVSN